MLPPIDESVLKNNPNFGNLYKHLTGAILNSDGSTKNDPDAEKRETAREELKIHRHESTRRHLLLQTVKAAAATTTSSNKTETAGPPARQLQHRRTKSQRTEAPLPPELLQLIQLLPPVIDSAETLSQAELTLLLTVPPFSRFPSLVGPLGTHLSSALTQRASQLARVLSPSTNPSFIHRAIPTLPDSAAALLAAVAGSRLAVSAARLAATHALATHLGQHGEALSQLVRVLEAQHGAAARSAVLRAEDAALELQLWAAGLQGLAWEVRGLVYPPDARAALGNYQRHLVSAKVGVRDRIRVREQELDDYGVAVGGGGDESKERTMREIARVWREMENRMKEVKVDLKRLDR